MLEIIAIVLLSIFLFPVAVPALLIAGVTSLTFWPTFAVILAAAILVGIIRR